MLFSVPDENSVAIDVRTMGMAEKRASGLHRGRGVGHRETEG
jgi:hypothetical protein